MIPSMNESGVLQIPDGSGHIDLMWNPNDKESLSKAQEEFDKLKAAGFAFFHDGTEVEGLTGPGELEVRAVITKELKKKGRTVAVRPMRGG